MLDNKPDSIDALIDSITPEIYDSLRTAVELGKWDNGQPLSQQQLEYCLQAIIAYEHRNLPVEQRTGFMSPDSLSGSQCHTRPDTIASDREPVGLAGKGDQGA